VLLQSAPCNSKAELQAIEQKFIDANKGKIKNIYPAFVSPEIKKQ